MKKFIMGIVGLIFMNAISYGAVLSIFPQEGTIPENCIYKFDINLEMAQGDKAISSDIVLHSNMEFVDFEKGDVFKYSVPPFSNGDNVILMLFNDKGGEITQGGNIGTIRYKTAQVQDPYVEFTFVGQGDTTDTDINIDGIDILTTVNNGKFKISSDKVCENPVFVVQEQQSIDEFVKDFEKDHKGDQVKHIINQNKYIIFGGVISLIILVLIILLVSHRIQKKGGK